MERNMDYQLKLIVFQLLFNYCHCNITYKPKKNNGLYGMS